MKHLKAIVNLTAVFVTAFALSTLVHEAVHGLVAKAVGEHPVLFHSYVSYPDAAPPPLHRVYIAGSGPMISLLLGVVFLLLLRNHTAVNFITFFYLWMAVIGAFVFLGYMMLGPFVDYGDTGQVYSALEVPKYVSVPIAVLAFIAMAAFFRKLTPVLGSMMQGIKSFNQFDRRKTLWLYFIVPLLAGTLINVLLSLPAPTAMSLAFPVLMPFIMLPLAMRLFKSDKLWNSLEKKLLIYTRSPWPMIIVVVMIIISRMLVSGIKL